MTNEDAIARQEIIRFKLCGELVSRQSAQRIAAWHQSAGTEGLTYAAFATGAEHDWSALALAALFI